MRNKGISTTFTLFFDGQFWIGIIERIDGDNLSAARIVFGSEPSNEEIYQFVLKKWDKLRFSPGIKATQKRKAKNPKRQQRNAAKAAAKAQPSTKAQLALSKMREQQNNDAHKKRSNLKHESNKIKRRLRQMKHKQKHRGH